MQTQNQQHEKKGFNPDSSVSRVLDKKLKLAIATYQLKSLIEAQLSQRRYDIRPEKFQENNCRSAVFSSLLYLIVHI